MNHKLTLWPSIAAILIAYMPFFEDSCQKKVEPPKPLLEFRLIDPGIPGIPNAPPIFPPKVEPNLSAPKISSPQIFS